MDIARNYTLEAEQAVLGSMLIDPEIIPAALGFVNPADFQSDVNRQLFEAARALYREGSPVDAIIVTDKLGWARDKERRAYIAELMEVTPTSANWQEYAAIMHDQAMLRLIRDKAAILSSALTVDECREPATAIAEALGAGRRIEAWTLDQLLIDFADRKAEQAPKEYITIGLGPIDANTFLERGDVLMIGGAPSDGKTALGMVIAYTIRGALVALPGRLAVDVAAVQTPAEASEVIRREVYKIMRELANYYALWSPQQTGKHKPCLIGKFQLDKLCCRCYHSNCFQGGVN